MSDSDPMKFETDFEMGQQNIRPFGLDIHNPVFLISGGVIVVFVIFIFAQSGIIG